MIRLANKFDIESIIDMLKKYREVAPLDTMKKANNKEYIEKLITEIIVGSGYVFLAEKNKTIIGMLIAAKFPNVWNPDARQMSEIAYWVEPEHRGGTAGYRLIETYIRRGEKLKAEGEIDFYTISKMVNSPDLKFNKLGFSKLEETWVR
jgi:N-acetylglutamate synthase-like GNAT family acetyltransferase